VRARSKNWLVHAPGAVDRIEARFSGLAFSPHRHDRYAIGIAAGGVQSFDDRPEPAVPKLHGVT
jgi:hypothetical protein